MKNHILRSLLILFVFMAGFLLRPVLLPVHFNFELSSANVIATGAQKCKIEPMAKVPGFTLFPSRYRILLKSATDESIIGRGTFRVSQQEGITLKFRTKQSSTPQKTSSVNIEMFPLLEEEAVNAMFDY